jgi:TRAP-type mannitol/chloroaromatic compound transport system permease large subunit
MTGRVNRPSRRCGCSARSFFWSARAGRVRAFGLACLPVLFIEPRLSPMVIFNTTFKAYNSFILLAVPFFLLTNPANVGGITDRLVTFANDGGQLPGALAQINVLLSVFFAGISGRRPRRGESGKIFTEAQVKEGYDLSIGDHRVSAVLAVIIPPSILMTGGVLSVSIGALYLAGSFRDC